MSSLCINCKYIIHNTELRYAKCRAYRSNYLGNGEQSFHFCIYKNETGKCPKFEKKNKLPLSDTKWYFTWRVIGLPYYLMVSTCFWLRDKVIQLSEKK